MLPLLMKMGKEGLTNHCWQWPAIFICTTCDANQHSHLLVYLRGAMFNYKCLLPPELVHSDQLISQAMKIHFEKAKSVKERAGYFFRRTGNVKQWIISEAVDTELKKPAKITFMKE